MTTIIAAIHGSHNPNSGHSATWDRVDSGCYVLRMAT
jgi:hypothetical protein